MKKKRYPAYRRKVKKKRALKKTITVLIICITLALCNGWTPPHTFEEAKAQGKLFSNVFLTYIEENTKKLNESNDNKEETKETNKKKLYFQF